MFKGERLLQIETSISVLDWEAQAEAGDNQINVHVPLSSKAQVTTRSINLASEWTFNLLCPFNSLHQSLTSTTPSHDALKPLFYGASEVQNKTKQNPSASSWYSHLDKVALPWLNSGIFTFWPYTAGRVWLSDNPAQPPLPIWWQRRFSRGRGKWWKYFQRQRCKATWIRVLM